MVLVRSYSRSRSITYVYAAQSDPDQLRSYSAPDTRRASQSPRFTAHPIPPRRNIALYNRGAVGAAPCCVIAAVHGRGNGPKPESAQLM
jgi:hypothetical protein